MTTETTTTETTVEQIVAENKAKLAEKESAAKAIRSAQQSARVVLADGLSELAKVCRRFVAAQGDNAEEATASLVLALMAAAEGASAK